MGGWVGDEVSPGGPSIAQSAANRARFLLLSVSFCTEAKGLGGGVLFGRPPTHGCPVPMEHSGQRDRSVEAMSLLYSPVRICSSSRLGIEFGEGEGLSMGER